MSAICDAHKKMDVEKLYNSVHRKLLLEIRCGRENQHPERMSPQAPGWAAQENGKETLLWPLEGGQYVAVLFSLQLPLTHNPFNKVRGIFF